MYEIWVLKKATGGFYKFEFHELDAAQVAWDALNASDKLAMRSTRP